MKSIVPAHALVALALASTAGTARADDGVEHCTGFVTSLPLQISDDGVWCMDTDLATAAHAPDYGVRITAGHVVLDCKGHALRHTDISSSSSGISTLASNRRVTIRNCRVEGFRTGIWIQASLTDSPAVAIVEDNVLVDNLNFGIRADGIRHAQIRRNTVIDAGTRPTVGHATGILVQVDGDAIVHDNVVAGVAGGDTGSSWIHSRGINVTAAGHSSVVGNIVSDMLPGTNGAAYGVFFPPGSRATVRDNQVTGDGRATTRGIACADSSGVILVGNTVSGVGRPADKCPGDAGGTYVTP